MAKRRQVYVNFRSALQANEQMETSEVLVNILSQIEAMAGPDAADAGLHKPSPQRLTFARRNAPFFTIRTDHDYVLLPDFLMKHPKANIMLQQNFWGLSVARDRFHVCMYLSDGLAHRLTIPYTAIERVQDNIRRSVGLEFEWKQEPDAPVVFPAGPAIAPGLGSGTSRV